MLGDSRAILSVKGEAKALSYDHKGEDKSVLSFPGGLICLFARNKREYEVRVAK